MVTQAEREAKKELGRETIHKVLKQGGKLGSVGDVAYILEERAKSFGSPDFFDCLAERDYHDLYNSIHKRTRTPINTASPIHTNPGSVPPSTPPQTPLPSEQGERCEAYRELDDGLAGAYNEMGQKDSEPIIGKLDAEQYDIAIYNPRQARFRLLTGSYWNRRQSYMSVRIVRELRLSPDSKDGESIRLVWKKIGSKEGLKTPSTRFRIVQDKEITHDIVIGTTWNDPDYPDSDDAVDDDEDQRSYQYESEGEEEQSEGGLEEEEEEELEDDNWEEEADAQGEENESDDSGGGEEADDDGKGFEEHGEEVTVYDKQKRKRVPSTSEQTSHKLSVLNSERNCVKSPDHGHEIFPGSSSFIANIVYDLAKRHAQEETYMESFEQKYLTEKSSPKRTDRSKREISSTLKSRPKGVRPREETSSKAKGTSKSKDQPDKTLLTPEKSSKKKKPPDIKPKFEEESPIKQKTPSMQKRAPKSKAQPEQKHGSKARSARQQTQSQKARTKPPTRYGSLEATA